MNVADTPRRIAGGFAVILLISLLLGIVAIWRVVSIARNATSLATNSVPSVIALNRAIQANAATLRAVRVMVMVGHKTGGGMDSAFLAAKADGDAACRKYEELISDDEDRRLFREAVAKRDELLRRLEKARERIEAGQAEEATATLVDEVDPANEACIQAFNADVAYNDGLANGQLRAARSNVAWSLGLIGTGLALSLLLGGLVGLTTVRATRRALDAIATMIREGVGRTNRAISGIAEAIQTNADQTAVSAAQLSAASRSLAHGCSEQTASVTETGASLEEMSAMIRATAENAAKATALARETRSAAEAGRRTMADMEEAMRSIEASGLDVAKIVKNIDEIAFQTNILALNAAVEAARAGESGAGFAVVADEVRALAQRSAAAAKETAGRIDAALGSTKRGVTACSEVGQSLGAVLVKAAATDGLAAEIAMAAREQAQGIQQVNSAMAQIDKVTQSNATGAEQASAAVEELRGQAGLLKESVERLRRVMVDAERGSLIEATRSPAVPGPEAGPVVGSRWPADHEDASFRAF